MKYQDKITYIRRGGSSKSGKVSDRVEDVIFVREDGDSFLFIYPDNPCIGKGKIADILTVNGHPV